MAQKKDNAMNWESATKGNEKWNNNNWIICAALVKTAKAKSGAATDNKIRSAKFAYKPRKLSYFSA